MQEESGGLQRAMQSGRFCKRVKENCPIVSSLRLQGLQLAYVMNRGRRFC